MYSQAIYQAQEAVGATLKWLLGRIAYIKGRRGALIDNMGNTVDENVRASEIWAEEVIHLNCPASQGVCSVSTCVEVPTFLLYGNYHSTKALHLMILVSYVLF